MSVLDAVGMQTPCPHVLSIFAALQAAWETYETLIDTRQIPSAAIYWLVAPIKPQLPWASKMEFSSIQTAVMVLNSQGAMGDSKDRHMSAL